MLIKPGRPCRPSGADHMSVYTHTTRILQIFFRPVAFTSKLVEPYSVCATPTIQGKLRTRVTVRKLSGGARTWHDYWVRKCPSLTFGCLSLGAAAVR